MLALGMYSRMRFRNRTQLEDHKQGLFDWNTASELDVKSTNMMIGSRASSKPKQVCNRQIGEYLNLLRYEEGQVVKWRKIDWFLARPANVNAEISIINSGRTLLGYMRTCTRG